MGAGVMSEMLAAALEYAAQGYSVFPCVPGKKIPKVSNGRNDATNNEQQIEAWWSEWPDANIGLVTDGLVVIDVDGKDNPWPADHDQASSLIDAPTSVTPSGGRHTVFKQPEGREYRSTASRLADAVDTRAGGGYIVVSPSKLLDGGQYQWIDGLELCDRANLPEPPEWLVTQLDALQEGRTSKRAASVTLGDGNPIPDGLRNDTLTRLAGGMRRNGMGYNAILHALLQENLDRCCPPMCESEVERIARSVAKYEPDQVSVALIESHLAQQSAEPIRSDAPQDPGDFPKHLLRVPGFLGDFSRHCLAYAHREQPVLALGASVSLMSLLIGRKVIGPNGVRGNLYSLAVAGPSAGKESSRSCIKDLMNAAGGDTMVGEGIASHVGLNNAMIEHPAKLWLVDEAGRWLCGIGSAGERAPWLQGILTNFMKLYTSSHTTYYGDAYGDSKRNLKVEQPHCVLFGSSTPETLYKGLTVEQLEDGFLSRVLIWEAPDEYPPLKTPSATKPPGDLIEYCQKWIRYFPGSGGLAPFTPQPVEMGITKDAKDLLDSFRDQCDERLRGSISMFRSLWGRAQEKARKLALIHAASKYEAGEPFGICWEDAAWAVDLAEYLTRRLVYLASRWVSDGAFDSKRRKVLREIEKAGKEGLTQSQLCRATRGLTTRERAEAIDSLCQAGDIHIKMNKETKGRSSTVYVCNTQ